jgi:glycosyltransferase involved in cell wall biosynthesis
VIDPDGSVELRTLPLRDLHLTKRSHLFRVLESESTRVNGAAIVHDHGLWLPVNHRCAVASRMLGLPRIVSPHGMLSDVSRRKKWFKKFVAWHTYQRRDLSRADVVHVTSEAELRDLRSSGWKGPIHLSPNGVRQPPAESIRSDGPRTRNVLFMSRVHPIKGITHLLEAWKTVGMEGWTLTIAGPVEDAALGRRVSEASRLDASIKVIGAVDDHAKWDVYGNADLFVLPTLSENFGIVIAEALAAGMPVISTKAAPWQELETHDCGWWIDTGTEPLVAALRHAMDRSDAERQAMGVRGRKLVEENYSWDEVARKMIAVYEWVLGRGARPDWVDV